MPDETDDDTMQDVDGEPRESGVTDPSRVLSISAFCRRYRIGRTTYYKLQREGQGPEETRVSNRKVFITLAAALTWETAHRRVRK